MSYAENTSVPVDRSKSEIEKTLQKYGADQFVYGWDHDTMVVGFRMNARMIQFKIPMPTDKDVVVRRTRYGVSTSAAKQEKKDQLMRQRWRALLLVMKAKLEAVSSGITEFEQEFLAHIVLPGGQTVGSWMKPQIEDAYSTGKMPKLLTALSGGEK